MLNGAAFAAGEHTDGHSGVHTDEHGMTLSAPGDPHKVDRTIDVIMTDNEYSIQALSVKPGQAGCVGLEVQRSGVAVISLQRAGSLSKRHGRRNYFRSLDLGRTGVQRGGDYAIQRFLTVTEGISVSYPYGDMLRRQMHANVSDFSDRRADPEGLKHAAVALTVVDSDHGAAFLLTRRASKLRAHSGQFALPGGRVEAGETSVQAALREMHEEVGVELGEEAVLGLLDDYPTRSGYRITPVVVWAGSTVTPKADPGEVARIHVVSLAQLARDDTPEFASIPESDRPLIRLNIANAKVHAPTAAVIYQFREVAIFGRNARVDHLEQPVWAWK